MENITTFSVIKKDPSLIISVDDMNYGEDTNITVVLPVGVTGYVLVTIDNKIISVIGI